MLTKIHVGAPEVRGALTLFPVWSEHAEGERGYISGVQAEAQALLTVDEMASETVPQLQVFNDGGVPLLLLEGETLAGGLQTRVLNVSVLVPPKVVLPVPVACVEAGRWGARAASRRGASHAPPGLRSRKTASVNASKIHAGARFADQGAVWASVADYSARLAAPSPTSSMLDVMEHRRADAQRLTEGLTPLPGQRGVIVGIGGVVRGLELFDSAVTFAEYFDSLLDGYVTEALAANPVRTPSGEARRFVRRLAQAQWSFGDAVGVGSELVVGDAEGLTGTGVTWSADRPPVHMAVFA